MPRGIYQRKNTKKDLQSVMLAQAQTSHYEEPEHIIYERIAERFKVLNDMVHLAISGDARAVIASGPGGLGKSFTVEHILSEWDPDGIRHISIKGYVRPTGLFRTLWDFKQRGNVILFDDADSIFYDDVSLNMLKAVCDTNKKRVVSYLSEYIMVDNNNEVIPRSFEFEGSIIFLSNLDFDLLIERGHKLAPHLEAMMTRAHYIDLSMKTRRDYIVRIKQVIEDGLLEEIGLTKEQTNEVIDFLDKNSEKMRKLNLREVLKIAIYRKNFQDKWRSYARIVTCR